MNNLKNKKFFLVSFVLIMSIFVLTGCTQVSLTGTTGVGNQNGAPADGGTPPEGMDFPEDGGTPPEGMTPPTDGGSMGSGPMGGGAPTN